MKKSTIIGLIIAFVFVICGVRIFVAACSSTDFDLKVLDTNEYINRTYKVEDDFDKISIRVHTTDITFMPSNDNTCRIESYEIKKVILTVNVQNETLEIGVKDERNWFDHFGIFLEKPKMTIYLPKDAYESFTITNDTGNIEISERYTLQDLNITVHTSNVTSSARVCGNTKIETDTGHINLLAENAGEIQLSTATGGITIEKVVSTGEIKIESDTGKIILTDVDCRSLRAENNTGKITLTRVFAYEDFYLENDTGSIVFDASDAAEIYAETDTGSITGTIATEKIFFADSDLGSVSVPKSDKGGRCELSTDTGKIDVSVLKHQ